MPLGFPITAHFLLRNLQIGRHYHLKGQLPEDCH